MKSTEKRFLPLGGTPPDPLERFFSGGLVNAVAATRKAMILEGSA